MWDLLRGQLEERLSAFSGAQGSLTLPVSDRFLGSVLNGLLPPLSPLRRLTIKALAGNVLVLRVGLAKLPLLPDVPVELRIEDQAEFPDRPVVTLRILSIARLRVGVAFLLSFVTDLSSAVSIRGDLIELDFRALLQQWGGQEILRYLERVQLTTVEGAIVLSIDAAVPHSSMTFAASTTVKSGHQEVE